MSYVDKTGTDEKPNPLIDVFEEFPRAMLEVAKITAFGAKKHAPRGWQTFTPKYGIRYHLGKVGRHILKRELEGEINHEDGGNLHMAAVAWNALAALENVLKQREQQLATTPHPVQVE